MDEIWKAVPGFGDHYEASSLGRVRVKERTITRMHPSGQLREFHYGGRLLSPNRADKYDHLNVCIGQNGKDITVAVHKLVLLAFVGPCPADMEACHNNGIGSDNRKENLRWDTHAANCADRKRHGRYAVGESHHMARIDSFIALAIRDSGLGPTEAGKQFGVSTSQAHRIIRRKNWVHLGDGGGL